jgi:hypothetical protein
MNEKIDWYPTTRQGEKDLYENIDAKIDAYKTKYPFLTDPYVAKIHTMCRTFIECYDKTEQNRATAKQMTTWFTNIVGSKQKNEPVPPAPVFLAFAVPAGANVGIEEQCRKFAGLMKEQDEYEKADGLDLMIEKGESAPPNLGTAQPELKITVNLDNSISFGWKKAGFDSLELQWRKAGTEMWQHADKSNVSPIEFTPSLTTPGIPEKFEFRAVYIIKNQRVGQWSPTYTQTVG